MSRLVDRGAVTAAFVGIGMAVTIGISFLLVIPIEPVYWALSVPAGLLIGYYADARSGRGRGAWRRILANSLFAGVVTGLTLAALLIGVKALFFAADDGYRDPGLGGRLSCVPGGDCVYRRYLEDQPEALAAAGVTDAASFSTFFWAQQWSTAALLVMLSTGFGVAGGVIYGVTRPRDGAVVVALPPASAPLPARTQMSTPDHQVADLGGAGPLSAEDSRAEMDTLVAPLVEFAQAMLVKQGQFAPFGSVMTTAGAMELLGSYDESADAQALVGLLVAGCRTRATAGTIRAAAICYDARWTSDDGRASDAIAIAVEHRDAEPITIMVPYAKDASGDWTYEPMLATAGQRQVFAPG